MLQAIESYAHGSRPKLSDVEDVTTASEAIDHYWCNIQEVVDRVGSVELATLVARLRPRLERIAFQSERSIDLNGYRSQADVLRVGGAEGALRSLSTSIFPSLLPFGSPKSTMATRPMRPNARFKPGIGVTQP
jgi:hypothetical protein